MTEFGDVYRGRRVLLTGHTGFKGSWLALWLEQLDADVTGISLPPPTTPNHWDLLDLGIAEHRVDIRDAPSLARLVQSIRPEIVFHLAAQAIVRRSYRDPLETWSTNVMGTANLLEACRRCDGVRALVVVTSDKCYENRGTVQPYGETDRLGGRDPYSASKAAAEFVASSYRDAIFANGASPLVATGRAGNVIGGGDWAEDRLLPDVVRAMSANAELTIRAPDATRPWQHVLESIAGYLALGRKLVEGDRTSQGGWNFGPAQGDHCTVAEVLKQMRAFWPKLTWRVVPATQQQEAHLLQLDSTKARSELGWRPVWSLDAALRATAEWYASFLDSGRVESRAQLARYVRDARTAGVAWSAG